MTRSIQDALRKSSDINSSEFIDQLDAYKRKNMDAPAIDISYLGIRTNKNNLVKYLRNIKLAHGHSGYNNNAVKLYYGNPDDDLDTNNDIVDTDDYKWSEGMCKNFYVFVSNIDKSIYLDLIETFGKDRMFSQLSDLDLGMEKILTYYHGRDWDSADITNLKEWEKFLHCLVHHKETGQYTLLQAGFKSKWQDTTFDRVSNMIAKQASEGAGILNNKSSEFRAVDVASFGLDDKGESTDNPNSMIESKKVVDGKTVRIVFKKPIVADSIKLDSEVYRPNRSGVMRAFPIYAIDLTFRFGQFPTVRAYRDKECKNTAVHPNISSGSICLGDLKDADRVTSSEQEMRDGLDIPPLSDFVQTMKMVNLDSAFFGMSEPKRIVYPDENAEEGAKLEINTHSGLDKLRGF
jgi:hypothetical protein